MCGIVGIVSQNDDIVGDILQSLKRLEYRGYDSSGIAVINSNRNLDVVKEIGKIHNLAEAMGRVEISGATGLGHTRWATHGKVCRENSHPHVCGNVAVVHNGIIENYVELKQYLISQGEVFQSETDTEVIPVLINFLLKNGENFEDAFRAAIEKLQGAYAIAAICTYQPDIIAVAKNHSPLVVGYGVDLAIVGSDAFSVIALASKMTYLTDGDYGFVDLKGNLRLFDENHKPVQRDISTSNLSINAISKDGYKHYMLKEINEQPVILQHLLNSYFAPDGKITLPNIEKIGDLSRFKRVKIIACGTSYYSGIVAGILFEKYAKLNTDVYISSEYRYKNIIVDQDTLYIAISQSGETADTIGAIKVINSQGGFVVAIVNNEESTIENISNLAIKCHAGAEIGVASTKVFTSQIVAQMALVCYIAEHKKHLNCTDIMEIAAEIRKSLLSMMHLLENKSWIGNILDIAKSMIDLNGLIYIGRGLGYPIAMEGALKLKELSYIHSEGMASGELKHGSIALIDKNMPVVAIAPSDELFDKNASNIENVLARDGRIILITDAKGLKYFSKFQSQIIGAIVLDEVQNASMPLLYSVAIQLLAYYVSLEKGNDVDQPRNLAKSVTVE